jgi:hypothetical protein
MPRGPRSRASRAERRMQKERAASALAHGQPVPTPLPSRVRGGDPRSSRWPQGGAFRTPVPNAPQRGLPLGVKLLGLALGLLGLVYGLTFFRDHLARLEASSAPSPSSPSSAATSGSRPPNLGASLNAASLSPEPAPSSSAK